MGKEGDRMASFSFCGIDIKSLGLEYAPEMEDTNVFKPAETKSYIETFDGHDGGYFYGAWYEPKEFVLRCFFEDTTIDRGIMTQIYHLFRVGNKGKLIFDRRPWCYYYATVTDPIDENFSNYRNGIITIHMKAMYPFAKSDISTSLLTDINHTNIMQNSAMFDKENMEPPLEYNLTSQTIIILANTGTVTCPLNFEISGNVGDGVTIYNQNTGQSCKMANITKAITTDTNKVVKVNSLSGKTTLEGAGSKTFGFLYHQEGFLSLEPSFPVIRDVYISCEGRNVYTWIPVTKAIVGQYVYIQDNWYKIISVVDENNFTINKSAPHVEQERTTIMKMNELIITPETTMDITLKFNYFPTYY